MNRDDLDRELNELWAKVTPSPMEEGAAELPFFMREEASSPVREGALEAIQLLKRRHREQAAHWEEMLEAKDQALRQLAERLRAAEGELAELRRFSRLAEDRIAQEMRDASGKLEAGREALVAQEQRFRHEETILRELLDKTRQQLSSETKRWRELEDQWVQREQQYLSDLHEMQARLSGAQQETGRHEEAARKRNEDIKEAKRAIEATLTELLAERRQREEANQDREKAQQRVVDLTERLAQIQKAWDEERKQWQELWDRERSTWETQRQEFAGWEERLRKEREAWHQDLQKKEEEVLRFSSQMADTLRESTETGDKLSRLLKAAAAPPSAVHPPRPRRRLWPWIAGAAAIAVSMAAVPAWRYLAKPRFLPISSHVLTLDEPTAVAYDGGVLWAAEWSGGLATLSPQNPSTVLGRYSVMAAGPYHPVSIALGSSYLWSLDAAQGRILKHSLTNPAAVLASWATPGPAPVALSYDGQNLWSYDAVAKSFYRQAGEGPSAQITAYRPEVDMVPTSMAWLGSELWVHDSKAKRILRFEPDGKSLKFVDALEFDRSALSIAGYRGLDGKVQRRFVWALAGTGRGGPEFSIKRYKVRP